MLLFCIAAHLSLLSGSFDGLSLRKGGYLFHQDRLGSRSLEILLIFHHQAPPNGAIGLNKEIYGPISSVTVLGQTIVLIHDREMVFELLDKRSVKFSSRPSMFFGSEMCDEINIKLWKTLMCN